MRIAIPIHNFEPGGGERVALRLAEHWRDAGRDLVIVLGRNCGACVGTVPGLDYHVLRKPLSTGGWETVRMIRSFFQFLLLEKVDAVFCPGNTYTVICAAMKLLLGDQCPPVLVKISNDLERRGLPKFIRPSLERFEGGLPAFQLSPNCRILRRGFDNGHVLVLRFSKKTTRPAPKPLKNQYFQVHDAGQYLNLSLTRQRAMAEDGQVRSRDARRRTGGSKIDCGSGSFALRETA